MKFQYPDDDQQVAIYATVNGKFLRAQDGPALVLAAGRSIDDDACIFIWGSDGSIRSASAGLYLGYNGTSTLLSTGTFDPVFTFGWYYAPEADGEPDGTPAMIFTTDDGTPRCWSYTTSLTNEITLSSDTTTPPNPDRRTFVICNVD
ncbi:hypothetical protein BOSP111201_20195 [Bordetella sputigena]|uniref:hypothetical protein n=1 Tax=Bordetella sputigena TaxID=1416810 RepID=UPI0039EF28E8